MWGKSSARRDAVPLELAQNSDSGEVPNFDSREELLRTSEYVNRAIIHTYLRNKKMLMRTWVADSDPVADMVSEPRSLRVDYRLPVPRFVEMVGCC